MKIIDLGRLEGQVLLFGGPYSNLQATKALFALAAKQGIGAAHMICTGDVVAYCADAMAVTQAVRASGCAVLAGNCEKQLAAHALDCGCGFEDGTTCDLLSAGWYAHANAQVDADARDWMGSLPDIMTFEHHGRRYAVVHGGVTDIARFLWPTSPEAEFTKEVTALRGLVGPFDAVIAGHSGLPFLRQAAGVEWINAGVIGMPPHDAGSDTRYALLEQGQVRFGRLSYDAEAAAQAMRNAGLVQGYDSALLSGIWPSEDVLPPDLRRQDLRASG